MFNGTSSAVVGSTFSSTNTATAFPIDSTSSQVNNMFTLSLSNATSGLSYFPSSVMALAPNTSQYSALALQSMQGFPLNFYTTRLMSGASNFAMLNNANGVGSSAVSLAGLLKDDKEGLTQQTASSTTTFPVNANSALSLSPSPVTWAFNQNPVPKVHSNPYYTYPYHSNCVVPAWASMSSSATSTNVSNSALAPYFDTSFSPLPTSANTGSV